MKYPCPVCGYLIHDEPPDSYAICRICFWEDDVSYLVLPITNVGGPNKGSLWQAQQNYQRFGVSEERFKGSVRQPSETDLRDEDWFPISDALAKILPKTVEEYGGVIPYGKATKLYYWRPDYVFRDRVKKIKPA